MLNFVENSKNIKFLLFFGICFMLLAMPINAETVTLTTDIYRDMQYSKNNPLTISNGDISLNNSKMTMYANLKNSLSNSLINLSQTFINIDYTIKDYGYYRKWSLNLTKPSLTAYNIQDIGFYFSNCKKYSENILHCDGIELDFSDLAEDFTINMNDFNMTISNEKLLNKSNIFLDPTDQLIPNATNKAYANTTATTSATAWLFGSSNEFSSTQYNQVNTSDNVRFSQLLNQYTTTRYNYYKFTFNLTAAGININDVTQIVLYHEGFYETSGDSFANLYYYNTSSGTWTSWVQLDRDVDTVQTKTITNPSSIFNSSDGLVQFGVRLTTMRFFGEVTSYTDFAYINVTTSAGDSTAPTYSLNSTNSTIAGTPISHNLYWQDNVGLSGYIFQFCNGTWNGSGCLKNSKTLETLDEGTGGSIYEVNEVSLALDSLGYAHISYQNITDTDLIYCNNTLGSWTCKAIETLVAGAYARTAIDSQNFVHLFHIGAFGRPRYCNNTVGSWSCVEINQNSAKRGSLAIDLNNYAHICYKNYTSLVNDLVYCNNTNNYAWSCTAVETDGNVGEDCSIAIDSQNHVHISHYNRTSSHPRYCDNTLGSWSCSDISEIFHTGFYTSLAIDSNDKVHIVYEYLQESNEDPIYCNNTLGSWSCQNIWGEGRYGEANSIALDENNKPHILTTNFDGGVAYFTTEDFSVWNKTEIDTVNYPISGSDRSIAIKKGRIVDTTSFSSEIHFSYFNSITQYAMYGKLYGWQNDTWTSFSTTWSNVTKVVNSTVGANIAWCVYANDTSNNWNSTSCSNPFTLTTTDGTPPTYSLNSTNSTLAGTNIEFRLNWSANAGLSKAITSLWNGSSWVNASSWCDLSSTSWCNQTFTVNSTPQQLWWKQYANDTSDNWNTSENFSLVTDYNISTCFNLDQAGAIYYLTADIVDSTSTYCMNISADNITLDCQNHLIQGVDGASTYGVFTNAHDNIIIKNCLVSNWTYGVRLNNSNYGLITNCTAYYNYQGLRFMYSHNSNITNNIMHDNLLGGGMLAYGYLNSFSNNLIYNQTIDNGWSGFGLYFVSEQNDTVRNNTVIDTVIAISIFLGNISYNTFEDNLIYNTYSFPSWGIIMDGNPVLTPTDGVHDNIIQNNTLSGFQSGAILLQNGVFNNTIKDNIITEEDVGIALSWLTEWGVWNPYTNYVYNNLLNTSNPISMDYTSYMTALNTTKQSGTRIYSSGTQIGGNYYTNSTGNGYSDTCTDSNHDGFCDTPKTYTFTGECQGTPEPCSYFNDTSDEACWAQFGCDWNYDDNTCFDSPYAFPCILMSDETSCANQVGCSWNNTPSRSTSDYLPLSDEYVANTCTYSGSGDWHININDNCTLSTTNTVSGNMYVYGSNGYLIFLANQLAYAYYVNATGSWNWYYNSYRILY